MDEAGEGRMKRKTLEEAVESREEAAEGQRRAEKDG